MMSPDRRPLAALGALALAGTLVLAGCSGDDGKQAEQEPSAEPTMVDGVTVQGLDLAFGEPATFTWDPAEGTTGMVEATVESARVVDVDEFTGYQITDELRAGTFYYVEVSATNVGDADVGGAVLPLYLDDGGLKLYPSMVFPNFEKCAPRNLPEEFAKGDTAELCMIFQAPQGHRLRSIALMPREGFQQIDWTGEVIDLPVESPSADPSASSSADPSVSSSADPSESAEEGASPTG